MMKNLCSNELFKIRKQTAFLVLAIIIAVIIFFEPVISFLFTLVTSTSESMDIEWFKQEAEYADEEGNSILEAYYMCEYNSRKFFADNDISSDNWKYNGFFSEYNNMCMCREAYRLIVEEKVSEKDMLGNDSPFSYYLMGFNEFYLKMLELEKSNFSSDISDYDSGVDYEYGGDTTEKPDDYNDDDGEDKESNIVSYEKALEDANRIKGKFETTILTISDNEYLIPIYDGYVKDVSNLKAMKAEFETILKSVDRENNPDDYEECEYNIAQNACMISGTESICEAYKYMIDHNVAVDSWQYETIKNIISDAANQQASSVRMPFSLFEARNGGSATEKEYNEYLTTCANDKAVADEALKVGTFSILNNSPVSGTTGKSGRSAWESSISFSITVITIFCIVVAGMSVANEHSSGTIRLLIARPQKRSSLIAAKLYAVLIIMSAFILYSFIVTYILSLILYRGDLLMPEPVYLFGGVFSSNAIPVVFVKMLIWCLFPAIMVLAALLLSSLTKKAAAAIVIPVSIFTTSSSTVAICALLSQFIGKINILGYTILPFTQTTIYTVNAAEYFQSMSSFDLISGLFGNNIMYLYPMTRSYSLIAGIVVSLIHIALTVYLTFLAFCKKEIKS